MSSILHSGLANHGIMILMPVFNDWTALQILLTQLDRVLTNHSIEAQLLIVNDGSTTNPPPRDTFQQHNFTALTSVNILHMRCNLGHQRAIAIGLAYIEDKTPCDTVVVMDSDGEDAPEDIPRLLEKYWQENNRQIIFAERTRRSESLSFRIFYWLYRVIHVVLTGRGIRVGNFSVIPRHCLSRLVAVSDLWNHYAAAVFTSRQPFETICTTRAKRLDAEPKMNFVNLVVHGLSAISVYSHIVGVRLLLTTSLLIVLSFVGLAATVIVTLATDLATPGWATSLTGMLLILLFQMIMFTFVFSFVILAGRNSSTFLPLRDYVYFVGAVDTVY